MLARMTGMKKKMIRETVGVTDMRFPHSLPSFTSWGDPFLVKISLLSASTHQCQMCSSRSVDATVYICRPCQVWREPGAEGRPAGMKTPWKALRDAEHTQRKESFPIQIPSPCLARKWVDPGDLLSPFMSRDLRSGEAPG